LAGTDFFTAEVLTLRGPVTYYVLFFIHLESRQVDIAGITVHPDEPWMKQIARNVTMEGYGALQDCRYLLHDRDTKSAFNLHNIRTGWLAREASLIRATDEVCRSLGKGKRAHLAYKRDRSSAFLAANSSAERMPFWCKSASRSILAKISAS